MKAFTKANFEAFAATLTDEQRDEWYASSRELALEFFADFKKWLVEEETKISLPVSAQGTKIIDAKGRLVAVAPDGGTKALVVALNASYRVCADEDESEDVTDEDNRPRAKTPRAVRRDLTNNRKTARKKAK